MLLENKVAVVFGAGGAVGGAVAKAYAREGARVHLVGRTQAKLEHVASDIQRAGGSAQIAQVDTTDGAAVDELIDKITKAGRIDASFDAVGNGRMPGTPLLDLALDDVVDPVSYAVRTKFNAARAVARQMVRQRSGVLLTVVSPHARVPIPLFGSVGAICGAIEALWMTLAAELGSSGVRTVCLCSAGSPDAPQMSQVGDALAKSQGVSREQMEQGANQAQLLRRFPMLAEVASAAAYYASDYASATTATLANVSAGGYVS